MVIAIKSGSKVKRNKESRVTGVRGMEDAVKSGKETCFRGVTRSIGGLKFGDETTED